MLPSIGVPLRAHRKAMENMITSSWNRQCLALILSCAVCGIVAVPATAATSSLALGDGHAGTNDLPTTLNFPLTRTPDLGFDVSLHYHAIAGSAIGGSDYVDVPYRAFLPAGMSEAEISVDVLPHPDTGADATLQLALDGAVGIGAAPSFGFRMDFSVGVGPAALASADFNGDGIADLVSVRYASPSLSVLRGLTAPGAGAPAFATAQTLIVGNGALAVRTADFNGDGKPDIAMAASNAASVYVLLNTTASGDTTLSFALPPGTFAVERVPAALEAADVNGDGRVDLVVASSGADSVCVLLGTTPPGATTPSFATTQNFASGVAGQTLHGLAVVDFTGDGVPDFAFTDQTSNKVVVRRNLTAPGSMTVALDAPSSFDAGAQPRGLVASDLNGDGRLDLAVANFGGGATMLVNAGAPGDPPFFHAATHASFAASAAALTAADLNGDGKADLVASTSNGFAILRNATLPGASSAETTAAILLDPGEYVSDTIVADFNGDGRPDLAAAMSGTNKLAVLLASTATPSAATGFSAAQNWAAPSPLYLLAGDLNGDGKPDLLSRDYPGDTFSVLLNATTPGGASASFDADQPVSTLHAPSGFAMADMDGDGRLDVLVSSPLGANGGTTSIFLNTMAPGTGVVSFAAAQDFDAGVTPDQIVVADFNGDGRLDLAAAGGSTRTVVLRLNTAPPGPGNLGFSAPQIVTLSMSFAQVVGLAARDVNGDGRPDLLVSGGGVGMLMNTTPAGASTASFTVPNAPNTSNGRLRAIADLNGDGRPDFVLATDVPLSQQARVVLNTTPPGAATGSVSDATDIPIVDALDIAAADIDGDGRADLVTSGVSLGIGVLLNTTAPGAATPAFAAEQFFGKNSIGNDRLVLADLNADGRPDAITSSRSLDVLSTQLSTQYRVDVPATPATGILVHDFLFAGRFD